MAQGIGQSADVKAKLDRSKAKYMDICKLTARRQTRCWYASLGGAVEIITTGGGDGGSSRE